MSNFDDLKDQVIEDFKNKDGDLSFLLNILTILSLIGSALGILAGLLFIIGSGAWLANIPGFGNLMSGNSLFMGLAWIFAYGVSAYGVIQLRNKLKTGFYFYVIGQALALIADSIIISFPGFVIIFVTLAFIGLYLSCWKELR